MNFDPYLTENTENQLRQYTDSQAVFAAHARAEVGAADVRGSMLWRTMRGVSYLIRTSASGAQRSIGVESPETREIFTRFMARKQAAAQSLKSLAAKSVEMRKLNRVYGVGRVPNVVVSVLQNLSKAGVSEQFMTVGTHAIYAYESACGVRIGSEALATRDIDLLYDTRKHVQFVTTIKRLDTSLIAIFQKADRSFHVLRDQLQTAINDDGFEIDVIRRAAIGEDPHPHPLRMSESEEDFWAVQVDSGNQLLSSRRFDQMVVSTSGEMALMRTIHPLDFVRIKSVLARSASRDPLKSKKDALQAQVVQHLWEKYLRHLDRDSIGLTQLPVAGRERGG
ncbi:MAG TPA: GSU2403 family nucleotidyltransferase fold protein [Xanthomonadales bacterium]|nr:GSU2403 family nucleotidyltransferase fold protein [Xanthomonadales bacterium]